MSGQLSATDVDAGETLIYTTPQAVAGFTLQDDGSWTFDPTDAAYQRLAAGATQQITITIPVTVTDSLRATDTQNLVITVTGTEDAAIITGTATSTVVEDRNLSGGDLTASGTLAVSDADTGEATFNPVTGAAGATQYGSFTMDAGGHWTYTADNALSAIQQLGRGQSLTDSIVVTTQDGTQQTLSVDIKGVIDAPALTVAASEGAAFATTGGGTASATLAAHEEAVIDLQIAAGLVDTAAPEVLLEGGVRIRGFPSGTTFNHGTVTSSTNGDSLRASIADLAGLEMTPPQDFKGPITLVISAASLDNTAGEGAPIASATATLHIDVAPGATTTGRTPQVVQASPAPPANDGPDMADTSSLRIASGESFIPDVPSQQADADHSVSHATEVIGLPNGFEISDGTHSATVTDAGAIDVSGWSLETLSVTAPVTFSGDVDFQINAQTTDGDTSSALVSHAVSLSVQAPVLTPSVDPEDPLPTLLRSRRTSWHII